MSESVKIIKRDITGIIVDADFKVTAIMYMSLTGHEKTLRISEIKEDIPKNYSEIRFENLSIRMNKSGTGLEIYAHSYIKSVYYFVHIYADETSIHPLEKKYGTNGLVLRKIIYRYMEEKSYATVYYVDYAVFDVIKENGETSELRIGARELYSYVLMMSYSSKRQLGSYNFYLNSGLCMFMISYGLLELPLYKNKFKDEVEKKFGNSLIFEKSTEGKEAFDRWSNKMVISGQRIDYDETTLKRYEGDSKVLTLPNFLLIDPNAFENSSVKEIILTSPVTVTHPGVLFNKYNQEVKIMESCNKNLIPLEDKGLFCSIMFRVEFDPRQVNPYHYLENKTIALE
jgi:hypothetical protein